MSVNMMKEYLEIQKIFEAIPELHLHSKKGGCFRFPIYLNPKLEETEIEVLELSIRAKNCLRRAGIDTIGKLCSRVACSSDLMKFKNCGATSASEIMDRLFAYHYYQLKPERRGRYLAKVIEMNVHTP